MPYANTYSLIQLLQDDLTKKSKSLRDQRKQVRSTSGGVRSYLNCQIFMVTRHQRRLSGFERDVAGRMGAIAEKEVLEPRSADAEMIQLLADVGKMKRRCKHILDVTDRYCVLTAEDLKIRGASSSPPRLAQRSRSLEEIPEESEVATPDTPDFPMEAFDADPSAAPAAAVPASSPITQNIVKSTFESFGSHLAVIAKTYTRKRGHSQEASSSSSSSSSEGATSAAPPKVGVFSRHRQHSASSLGV